MSTLLFDSMMPGVEAKERKEILRITTIKSGQDAKMRTCNIKIAQLILLIAQETADALLENRFRPFDALVKNFGCQMTALEVQQLVQNSFLLEEAKQIKNEISFIIKKIEKGSTYLVSKKMNIIDYINEAGLNLVVSPEFVRLVRFRMLSIVNDNTIKEGNEIPFTNLSPLFKKVKKLDNCIINLLISGLQAEESLKASLYIRKQAFLISSDHTPRAPLIQRLVDASFVRESYVKGERYSSIVSTPLLYNTEAVFRRTAGLVLLKNKLYLMNQPIENAKEIKIFTKFPYEEFLDSETLNKYAAKEPILVVEGYVKTDDLAMKISELGFFTILNANSTAPHVQQYASGTDQSPLGDDEADSELAFYQSQQDILNTVMQIDHIYCASLGEEK